ncbi:hypothetical protein [Photobacterium sp.]|nr:hypothetical protein [Photobacterium sp.]MDX1302075.1 hypothetical protein [Photobacterium sp.]
MNKYKKVKSVMNVMIYAAGIVGVAFILPACIGFVLSELAPSVLLHFP